MILYKCSSLERLPKDFNKLIKLSKLTTEGSDKLEWWEPDQSSILRKLNDIGCRMGLFTVVYDTDNLIQLINDGAHIEKITQFIIKARSR